MRKLLTAGVISTLAIAAPADAGFLDDLFAELHRTFPTDPSGSGDPSHSDIGVSGPERSTGPRDFLAEPACQVTAAAERRRAVMAAFAEPAVVSQVNMDDLTSHEIEVLEMLGGRREPQWGAWVSACLETLQGHGYCTPGPRYQITPKGAQRLANG